MEMVACKQQGLFPSNFFSQPWIIQCHGANKHTTTFIDPVKTDIEEKEIDEMKGKLCFGCMEECLYLWDEQTKECFFLDLNSLSKFHLPPLPNEDIIFSNFSLSSSPNHPNCTVILHGVKLDLEITYTVSVAERFLLCCQLHDSKWDKIPLDQDIIGATSVILDGKLYTCGVCSVIVFDVMSLLAGQVDMRTISIPMVAQFPRNDRVNMHLVESCGSIYLVRMYSYGAGPTNFIDINCLNTYTDEWLRASKDKAFNENLTSASIQNAKTCPWLMYQEKLDGKCKLLDPLNGIEHSTRIRLPSSVLPTQMLCSKDGWVILLDAANALFMVNPLIGDVVKLPSLDEDFCGITFTSVPTSDCLVLGFCTNRRDESIKIYKWHSGDKDWTIFYGSGAPFRAANTNPVIFQGELYCLGETGELRVFNPVEETWKMLDEPEPVYLEDETPFQGTQDCYLLELGKELVSVFKYNYSDYNVRIFKLDTWKMEWVPVNDLAGWTLFLDARCSFAKSSPLERWSNKIFFSAIHSATTKTCTTYCMESKRYDVNFCETKKPFSCVWLEPNLIRNS
ncbi:hypothetical protein LUZ63_000989 [Rhynchospora breviuscula]|uniref:KIB1-4 beta-propeller domain-containing protein n=1 Tax=Rhynchospora breviuscula TaxID=2022672 RepID=A0A9Q0CWJ1_9POAL|nr:hypothetical protein LUZ63_000989 [Rhynchospora breviuscula]